MKKYRIKKIGQNHNNILAELSEFGDSQDFFEGFALNDPTVNERFVLVNSFGGIVINTSPIIKIEEGNLTTVYSVYSIEEV